MSVSDGGDTVIDRTKNSLVASCFPPKKYMYHFIRLAVYITAGVKAEPIPINKADIFSYRPIYIFK